MPGLKPNRGSRAAACALLLAMLFANACTHSPPRLRIEAGTTTVATSGLNGTFQVTRAADGIPSLGTGGACLLMRDDASGTSPERSCRTDDECSVAPSLPAGSHAYCLEGDGHAGAGTCWVRPGPQNMYCALSRDQPLPIGKTVSIPAAPVRPGLWRVHACLNGLVAAACGTGGARQTDDGPVLVVPAGASASETLP